jgi:hypothetical protein
MQVKISSSIIAALMTTAIESGYPVTTGRKGGWCDAINFVEGTKSSRLWYADPRIWDGPFIVDVIEIDEES